MCNKELHAHVLIFFAVVAVVIVVVVVFVVVAVFFYLTLIRLQYSIFSLSPL